MSVTVYDAKKITELADGGVVNTATDKLLVSRGGTSYQASLGSAAANDTDDFITINALEATNDALGVISDAAAYTLGTVGKMVAVGDSLIGNHMLGSGKVSGSTSGYQTVKTQIGYLNWFQALYNYPFSTFAAHRGVSATTTGMLRTRGWCKGIPSERTYGTLSRLNDIVVEKPNVVFLTIGTNDIRDSGAELEQIKGNIQEILDRLFACGTTVWMTTVFPRNSFDSGALMFSTAQETMRLALNNWMRALPTFYRNQLILLDCEEVLLDEDTGELDTRYTYDGLHLNSLGAYVVAKHVVGPKFEEIYGQGPKWTAYPKDYDATYSPYGNLLTNSTFTGTGGSLVTATGVVPTSWRAEDLDDSSNDTVGTSLVCSIVTEADMNGDNKTFANLEFTSDGAYTTSDKEARWIFRNSSNVTSNISIGDYVEGYIDVYLYPTSLGSNPIRSVRLEVQDKLSGNNQNNKMFDSRITSGTVGSGDYYRDYMPDDTGPLHLVLKVDPVQLRSTTGISFRVYVDVDRTVAGTRAIAVGAPVLKKVQTVDEEKVQVRRLVFHEIEGDNILVIPKGAALKSIYYLNTTANAITGGIRIGTTAGGTDIVTAHAIAGNAVGHIPDSSILKRFYSITTNTPIYLSAVTAWNSASLTLIVTFEELI